MRAALLLFALALTGVLVFWIVSSDDSGRAARKHEETGARSLNAVGTGGPDETKIADEAKPFLRGRVLGPDGYPVHKAEISRLYPKPVDVVFTDKDGRYALPLLTTGRHRIEAAYGIDLTPQKIVIDVPESGEPEDLDFRLATAGYLFGRVVCQGEPVDHAEVDLVCNGEVIIETVSLAGLFAIDEEPPRGVELELRVRHQDAFQGNPRKVRYEHKGQQIGTVNLTAFSRVDVLATQKDVSGSFSHLAAVLDADELTGPRRLQPEEVWRNATAPHSLRLKKGQYRIVFGAGPWAVLRAVEIERETTAKIEISEPPPAKYRSRLVDHHGRALRARLYHDDWNGSGSFAACDRSGRFEIALKLGGLSWLEITALERDGEWLELSARLGFTINTEAVEDPVVIRLDGHLLVLNAPPTDILDLRRRTKDGESSVWEVTWDLNQAHISPPLDPGEYLLRIESREPNSPKPTRTRMIEIGNDLAVLDLSDLWR